jgi:hypothetical protein
MSDGDSSFRLSHRSSLYSGSFGMTGHIYVVGERSGDSHRKIGLIKKLLLANRRFFPFKP